MTRGALALFALLALVFALLTVMTVRSGVLRGPDPVAVGGPFLLTDQTGAAVDEKLLRGRWSIVFFGFTFCPDVCPTTLFALGQAETLLGGAAKKVQTVFVSVDPERDTPSRIAAYVATEGFPRAIRGLTGTPAQVAAAAKAYRVFYQKAGEGPDYLVNHSSVIYLMNPRGRLACVIPAQAPPQEMARRIKAAMDHGAGAETC